MDRWAFYRAVLAGEPPPVSWDHADAPWPGFWRVRLSARDYWRPAAIWDGEEKQQGRLGQARRTRGFEESAVSPLMLWSTLQCWRNPVSEAAYRHAVHYGGWWDSLEPAAQHPAVPGRVTDLRKAAPLGPRRGGA